MKQFVFLAIIVISQGVIGQHNEKVRVAVWEKFDKYSLPDSCVYINPKEFKNEKDDDENGFVDDINGIGFNYHEELVPEYFYTSFEERAQYDHGTAVAHLIAKNNPNILLYGVGFVPTSERLNDSLLCVSTEERVEGLKSEFERMEYFIKKSMEYFELNDIQVVNISWGLDLERFAAMNTNLGVNEKQIRRRSAKWLKRFRSLLTYYMHQYPHRIFVVSVGNEGKPVIESLDVPGSINLDNVITVGALDDEGNLWEYSNYGKKIDAYAKGTNIKFTKALKSQGTASGTSFAAPQVTAWVAEKIAAGLSLKEILKLLKEQNRVVVIE